MRTNSFFRLALVSLLLVAALPALAHHLLTTDQRQREIVTTVLFLARQRGPDAITTQAIADHMGVTQGATELQLAWIEG